MRMETQLPTVELARREQALEERTTDRMESALPNWAAPTTETLNAEPSAVSPCTDKFDPHRAKHRREVADPKFDEERTEALKRALTCERTERELPSVVAFNMLRN